MTPALRLAVSTIDCRCWPVLVQTQGAVSTSGVQWPFALVVCFFLYPFFHLASTVCGACRYTGDVFVAIVDSSRTHLSVYQSILPYTPASFDVTWMRTPMYVWRRQSGHPCQ